MVLYIHFIAVENKVKKKQFFLILPAEKKSFLCIGIEYESSLKHDGMPLAHFLYHSCQHKNNFESTCISTDVILAILDHPKFSSKIFIKIFMIYTFKNI